MGIRKGSYFFYIKTRNNSKKIIQLILLLVSSFRYDFNI